MDFEEWFIGQLPQLVRFATVVSGSADIADELVQDVAVKAQQHWPRLADLEHRDAYVRRMLVNEHLSFRRRFARIILRDDVEVRPDDRPQFADQHADRAALMSELNRLPARQRMVLVLRYFDDADDATIARTLGCRESTVRAYGTRALQTLRIHRSTDRRSPAPTSATASARPDSEEDIRAH